jgi:hypothetical protein
MTDFTALSAYRGNRRRLFSGKFAKFPSCEWGGGKTRPGIIIFD